MNSPPLPDSPVQEAPASLASAVHAAARLLAGDALSNGDRAALRRISPDEPYTPALWKVLLLLESGGHRADRGDPAAERRWALLLSAMAHLVDPAVNLHDPHVSLGEALARAGWSELRFVSLLRARGETLERMLRRMAQFLASKAAPVNTADLARLLFGGSEAKADAIRLEISRRYYTTLHQLEPSV